MNLQARIAIEALRAGVPNRAAIRMLGTEEGGIEQSFDELLQSVWTGSRPGLGIAGGFGTGKSHFLGYLGEVARTQNFAVSRVVISKETPLSDPARVLEAALRDATLPERNDDPIGAALSILRDSPDRLDGLEDLVRNPEFGLSPVFGAILFLLRKSSTTPETMRRFERFIAGGRVNATVFRQALSAAGAARMFDLRMPAAASLTQQRIRFASHLFQAAGFAGWCLLLDEVELIGRYSALQRAMAYSWLSTWLGLDRALRFPGIVTVYGITDDFISAVVEQRDDLAKMPERLRLKGRDHEAETAIEAIEHIETTVRMHRLRPPGSEELDRSRERLRGIYEAAYDWAAPSLPPSPRTATRTMRQYIKSWITLWDMERLTGIGSDIHEEQVISNYEENEGLAAPAADDGEEWS